MCSAREHCANAFRIGSSNSPFSMKTCAWILWHTEQGSSPRLRTVHFPPLKRPFPRTNYVLSRKTSGCNTEPEVPDTSQPLHQNRYQLTINFACHFEKYVVRAIATFVIETASLSNTKIIHSGSFTKDW